jgi:hypothetical protein
MRLRARLFFLLIVSAPLFAFAQPAPEFMVSWQADSYVRAWYQGKALPSAGSQVKVSVELVDNGRLVDLSKQEIRWLINSRDAKSGIGLQTITFNVDSIRQAQKIIVTIANYKGSNINHLVTIPRVQPEVVITLPALNQEISAGLHRIRGLPFFFASTDIGDLRFSWSANGENLAGPANTSEIELDTTQVPVDSRVNLSLMVQNLINPRESASQSVILRIK